MKVRFSHLSLSERRRIERWQQMKLSPDEIACRLGRHRSTIFRELRRNHFHDSEVPKLSGYWFMVTQSYAEGRRTRQRKLVRDTGRRKHPPAKLLWYPSCPLPFCPMHFGMNEDERSNCKA